jgi:hypothetical protein
MNIYKLEGQVTDTGGTVAIQIHAQNETDALKQFDERFKPLPAKVKALMRKTLSIKRLCQGCAFQGSAAHEMGDKPMAHPQ